MLANDARFLNQKTKFEQTFLNYGFGQYSPKLNDTILLFSVFNWHHLFFVSWRYKLLF